MEPPLAEARAALDRLRGRPGRLLTLAPFDAASSDPTPTRLLEHARARGRPVVGTICGLAPLELIEAVGAVPVRLDAGSAEWAALSADRLHRDTCPMVRSTYGLLAEIGTEPLSAVPGAAGHRRKGLRPYFRLFVVPRACDWKAALPETLASDFGLQVFPLDVPRMVREGSARNDWRRQIRELSVALQEITGCTVTKQDLTDAIALYRRASHLSRTLSASMAAPDPPLWGSDLLLVFSAALLMPIEEWIEAAEALVAEVRERTLQGEGVGGNRPRLLLAGSPCLFPHFVLPALAEECGGVIVADESCTGSRVFYDSVRIDEPTVPDMVDAIADRYLLPSTCPIFTDTEDRLLRLEALVEDFRPAGVIYHVLKSCFVYDMQLAAAQERFSSLGLPTLRLETDYGEANEESLRTRLEAFIETLRQPL